MEKEPDAPSPVVESTRGDRVGEFVALWLEKAKMREHLFLLVVAIIIGLLCGWASIGFKMLIHWLSHLFWGADEASIELIKSMPRWRVVLMPTIGGLLVGPIVYFFAREARGHGVPEVMAAVALKNGIIRFRVAATKMIASALTIASGGSAGREGPIIQIGAAIGSTLGQFLHVSSSRMRTFVGCGAAAGIAATFNAPIAGALFAVEVILGEFAVAQFSPIVMAAVIATVVSQKNPGSDSIFHIPEFEFVSAYELIPYLLLAIACGITSFLFIRALYYSEEFFDNSRFLPQWIQPAVGGLLIGLTGLAMPYVMGDGQEAINITLMNKVPFFILFAMLFGKILATSFTLGSGGSGGVFAPSLFVGATTGAIMGKLSENLPMAAQADVGAFALVGMAGVVAGTTHAPITAILIIAEITGGYGLILPLMMVAIISTTLSSYLSKESIYTIKLMRRGINIYSRRPLDTLKQFTVNDCLRKDFAFIAPETTAATLIQQLVEGGKTHFYVADEDQTYRGTIRLEHVRMILGNKDGLENLLIAEELAEPSLVCYLDDSLSQAFQKFERSGHPELPVVTRGERQELLGRIRYQDVLTRYNAEILRLDTPDTITGRLISSTRQHKVKVVEGYSMIDWDPPSLFWNKTIRQAELGNRYSIYVILIKKSEPNSQPIVPTGDYLIEAGDTLVIYGSDEDIERARKL